MGESTQEIKLNVPTEDGTSTAELTVRFVFNESGNVVRIEGSGPQHEYVGRLTLKGTSIGVEASAEQGTALDLEASGDHCVVCPIGKPCVVEVPCTSCN